MSSSVHRTPDEAPAARSSPLAISVNGVSKIYQIYDRPQHRLWQSLVRGRRRFYREFRALNNVTFDVRKNEVVGIVGRNGSGKSTLLQIVCGTLAESAGRVTTSGRVGALLELGAGFNPEFTGRENVHFNGALMGLSRDQIEARYERIVEFADIGPFIDQPIKTYSNGMTVRLAFAIVANIDADILVIDEALAVGDAFFVQKCMRFLRGFMKTGTILFVSHDTGAIVNLCHRAIWLHKGELVMDGPAREVSESYLQNLAEEAYGVKVVPSAGLGNASLDARTSPLDAAAAQPAVAPVPATAGFYDVLKVDLASKSFGMQGAAIEQVVLLDVAGRPTTAIRGGDEVTLSVRARASAALLSPIIGFIVKDRLGQVLLGDNTFERFAHQPLVVEAGAFVEARFTFVMPLLAPGEYTIGVAIAEGTQESHVQHHWIHDAVAFRSMIQGRSVAGLVGIPMSDVKLTTWRP
jgi:lipopolysaccharide transport system ATP-binding protein